MYNGSNIVHQGMTSKWCSHSYLETSGWIYLHCRLPSLLCPSCPEISVRLHGGVCWVIFALSFVAAKQLSPLRGTWHSSHLALVDVFFHQSFLSFQSYFVFFLSVLFWQRWQKGHQSETAAPWIANWQYVLCLEQSSSFSFLWTKVVFLVLLSNFFFASFCSFLALAFLTLFL